MTYVLEMSTDHDILATQLHAGWNPINARHHWAQVAPGGLNMPNGARIVVIAHGHDTEIGNSNPHTGVDISAEAFLALIQSNMAHGAVPSAIYLSTCGTGIAGFTANVRRAAQHNNIWHNVHLYGHHEGQAGTVQPPTPDNVTWTEIF
jgi:hypothetical protein